jgi:hypothetical protein
VSALRTPTTSAALGERKLGDAEGADDGEGDRYPYAVTTTIAPTMAPNAAVRIRVANGDGCGSCHDGTTLATIVARYQMSARGVPNPGRSANA